MNPNPIDDQLMRARQTLDAAERRQRALQAAETSLERECAALDELTKQFRSADERVRRLEGYSLVGLIYTVLGSKDTRLDVERRDLLSAKLKYDNARRRITGLEEDIASLRQQAAGLAEQRAAYAALLAEKEAWLKTQPGSAAQQLDELSKNTASAYSQITELGEAIQAGDSAAAGLKRAAQALESAAGWGTWDILGGGMLASAVKHNRLDEAQTAVREVQPLLQRFERELSDVNGAAALHIETGGLAAFADIFTDSLLVDLLVQSHISDSLEAVQSMVLRIDDLVARLNRQRDEASRRVQALERERRALLEPPA